MRRFGIPGLRLSPVLSALVLSLPALAQDDEPSLDFLEYLGSWEDEDESWYVEVQIDETDGEDETDESAPRTTRVEQDDD